MVNDSMTMDEKEQSDKGAKKLDGEDPKKEGNLKNEDKDFLWHNLNRIGTSVRRSSRSVFGRPTGNNVSGH